MEVGIMDADFLFRKRHNFPNLTCMKISAYHKAQGDNVQLITDPVDDNVYDRLYICKVFTDTHGKGYIRAGEVIRGGTGYYNENTPDLPPMMEHIRPDYDLYTPVLAKVHNAKWYTDFSIGYLTRGCFRRCPFCVNRKYNRAFMASPLKEFFDESRRYLCFLDDNFLSYHGWETLLDEVIATGRRFQFKQGLDERLLDDRRCKKLFVDAKGRYLDHYTFAFDNIEDYDVIESKLQLIRRYSLNARLRFYVLCGFNSVDEQDIFYIFYRIHLLFKYGAIPYLMRYQSPNGKPYLNSEWRDLYIGLARWMNQVRFVKKNSFDEYCEISAAFGNRRPLIAAKKFYDKFPREAAKMFSMKMEDFHHDR